MNRRGHVVRPLEYSTLDGPFIYLLGPVIGAPSWHQEAIQTIHALSGWASIVCPKRQPQFVGHLPDTEHRRQVVWELHYLKLVWKQGVTLCWFPKENEHLCDRAYAQTSRTLLGRTIEHHLHNRSRFVIGIEEDYSGMRYTEAMIQADCPEVVVQPTLRQVCELAVQMLTHRFQHQAIA